MKLNRQAGATTKGACLARLQQLLLTVTEI